MRIGGKVFDFKNECYIMGILNITPDSFSDGGRYMNIDSAVKQAEIMAAEGAAIIDVGGESTRPGHVAVSADEEIERVIPVIKELVKRVDLPVSIDTSKAVVARAAVDAGASLINDVWGFKRDKNIAAITAEMEVPCCLMHNRENRNYSDLIGQITAELKESVECALKAGVREDRIILDPGIGFGKDPVQNLIVMNNLEKISEIGFPWLLGASRKSMIGKALDLEVDERLEGTVVTTVMAVMKGASIIRVHDVKENFRAVKMTKAILESGSLQ